MNQKIKLIREQINSKFIATVFGSSVLSDELLSTGYLENEDWLNFVKIFSDNNISVLNGGYQASMRMISDKIIKNGGKCYGIVSSSFLDPCIKEHYTALFSVEDAFERLKFLTYLGDFYIFLPGGVGSLQEIICALWCIDRGFVPSRRLYFLGEYWTPIVNLVCSYSLMFKNLNVNDVIHQHKTPSEFMESLSNYIAHLKQRIK